MKHGILLGSFKKFSDSVSFLKDAFVHFYRGFGFMKAAALSYYTFLTFIPMLVLFISIMGLFLKSNVEVTEWVLDLIQQFTPTGFETIKEIVLTTLRISSTSTFVGFFGLLWSMLIFFGAIENIFNQIWEVEKRRHFIISKLVGIGMMSTLLFSALLVFFLTNTLLPLIKLEEWDLMNSSTFFSGLPGILLYLLRITLLTLIFFLVYKIIPALKVRNISAFAGALFASLGGELARIGYRFYLQQFPVRNLLYGSLLTAVVLLIWLNYTMIILVLGCEIACSLQKKLAKPPNIPFHNELSQEKDSPSL